MDTNTNHYPIDTIVVEMLLPANKAVGVNKQGEALLESFARDFAGKVDDSLAYFKADLCQEYGFGFLAVTQKGLGIHGYDWTFRSPDVEGKPQLPFLTIDFCTPHSVDSEEIADYVTTYFGSVQHVVKNMSDVNPLGAKDLAPDIPRQRLAVWGTLQENVTEDQMLTYSDGLSRALQMQVLAFSPSITTGHPLTGEHEILWTHWKESGGVLYVPKDINNSAHLIHPPLSDIPNNQFLAAIYTCRYFVEQVAVDFIKSTLPVDIRGYKGF